MKHSIVINQGKSPSKSNKDKQGDHQPKYLYIIKNTVDLYNKEGQEVFFFKVGISIHPEKRLRQLQTGCPFPLKVYRTYIVNNAIKCEQKVHNYLEQYHSSGEWFMLEINHFNLWIMSLDEEFLT